jgi:hypothetical protein
MPGGREEQGWKRRDFLVEIERKKGEKNGK